MLLTGMFLTLTVVKLSGPELKIFSDCMDLNIMMDPKPLFIDPFHPFRTHRTRDLKGIPRHRSRTQRPINYFFIDFGLSRRYDPSITNPVEPIIMGGDNTVPEFRSRKPQNPFPTDVYYIGHAIQETFLDVRCIAHSLNTTLMTVAQEYNGLEFIEPLILDMVQEDPSLRPTMEQAVSRLETICQGLGSWKLRSRLTAKKESFLQSVFKNITHLPRRFQYILRRLPAVPRPRQ
jgi:hypothetical protein